MRKPTQELQCSLYKNHFLCFLTKKTIWDENSNTLNFYFCIVITIANACISLNCMICS